MICSVSASRKKSDGAAKKNELVHLVDKGSSLTACCRCLCGYEIVLSRFKTNVGVLKVSKARDGGMLLR